MNNLILRLQTHSTEPIRVIVENEGESAPWLVVPLATLTAAIVAGVFLTINEHYKRKREDRRQWDKEIRDYCLTMLKSVDKIVDLARTGANGQPPTLWVDQHMQEFSTPNNYADLKRAYMTHALHPQALEQQRKIEGIDASLTLIAQAKTIKTSDLVLTAATKVVNNLHDGISEKKDRRDLNASAQNLREAIKKDIRI